LITDSDVGFKILLNIRGIILNKLISSPNQAVNQLFAAIAIIEPIINIKKNTY
jgi:hypothetical protein